jgi:hypothetical protein
MRQYHRFTDMKIMRYGAIVCVVLSGCAGQIKPEPPKACEPVGIPVIKYCDAVIPAAPDNKFDKTTKDDLLTRRIKALMLDRQANKDYVQELLEILKGCLKPEVAE